ncbi:unnamed protein product [Spirodela intermedia]|uniref:Uncharacterized protein n=1 Tax=Spirodela intermedia TaxID=51605 RepID=A0A7I8IZ43_SPIIN|nr:unnamed protein product [Spirodela intermedia]CAA6663069.1 unnamed protein product [Spirodela intermedia]CAA6674834.1 unnamed protein product [Spirodela intermedia]
MKSHGDPAVYRSVARVLQYLSLTQLDISFAVNQVYRSMHSPQSTNLTYLKHLLRYLKEQLPMASILNATQISLTTYSDVDGASSTSDRRSTGGFLIYLGSSLIS